MGWASSRTSSCSPVQLQSRIKPDVTRVWISYFEFYSSSLLRTHAPWASQRNLQLYQKAFWFRMYTYLASVFLCASCRMSLARVHSCRCKLFWCVPVISICSSTFAYVVCLVFVCQDSVCNLSNWPNCSGVNVPDVGLITLVTFRYRYQSKRLKADCVVFPPGARQVASRP